MWTLAQFGENLVGVMAEDGIIYEWALDTGVDAAAVANAPTASALFVTEEGILVALGADADPRLVQWCDQRNNTLWAADATNQAGDYTLQTDGALLQGVAITGGNILLTTSDVWSMTYTADDRVYSIARAGEGCGGISRSCCISIDAQAVWMGKSGFWIYNGFVQALPCDVWDYVFKGMNILQASKVTAHYNEKYGEVTWRYPSVGSLEVDRYVTYNIRENHFTTGDLDVVSGTDAGATVYPLMVHTDGYVYEHEVGFDYDGATPWVESGPFELGIGDNVCHAVQLLPDEATSGDVTATFFVRFTPEGDETSFGPYSLTDYTDVRFTARQARLRYDGATFSDWRVGTPRLDIRTGGNR